VLALSVVVFALAAWGLSGVVRSWASAEQCEAALGQARTALGEARVEDARAALGQAAAVCPADRNTELASLAREVQQAEGSLLCARIEADAATLLNQARPQQARRLLNEHEARCAARGEYRGLAARVDTRIRAAERALAEARMNLTQGALDAAADALQRAQRSDAEVIGAAAVESALAQARAAALQPPPLVQMPSPARAATAPPTPTPARQMPPPLPQAAPIASPPPPMRLVYDSAFHFPSSSSVRVRSRIKLLDGLEQHVERIEEHLVLLKLDGTVVWRSFFPVVVALNSSGGFYTDNTFAITRSFPGTKLLVRTELFLNGQKVASNYLLNPQVQ